MRTANHCPPDRVNGREATKTEAETEMRTRGNVCRASLFFSFSGLLGGFFMNHKLIRYSMQIAMIKQLLALSLITENEFHLIKNKTMRDYGIISDLTS